MTYRKCSAVHLSHSVAAFDAFVAYRQTKAFYHLNTVVDVRNPTWM